MKQEQLAWALRQWPRYTGILGLAGVVLLGIAAMSYQQKIKPVERDLQSREQSATEEQRRLNKPVASDASSIAALTPIRRADTLTQFLRELAELATKDKVVMLQTDYKSNAEGDNHLMRYGVQFPATGTYDAFRQFMTDLEKIPGVRIETFSVSRAQIADEQLTAQMQISYLTETP
ncbi:hypothetical protein SAMN02745857_00212 [Andreprevotia lacus DSM 23236]|jgi:hypothetical protein|uniref:Pilus assembly protein, PilO n=1 Tax=Andreprevotia lacus DSM 23236 TaxID=1121001 RepID=A0A1W1WXV5_9NEIS|nr:hypothetical protein [Andreprevotia lacus]SMC16559.1 hypothetical protein SAMN02745857_00212 [Andreprevotia lacus DSM 23236]